MLCGRVRRGRDKGEAALDARGEEVRERTFAIVRAVAQPFVDEGMAQLRWTAPEPGEMWPDGAVELVPDRSGAARVGVWPGSGLVTLVVGPVGYAHEVVVDPGGRWEDELRGCLEAVVGGRYRESVAAGRIARRVMTMTFEQPDTDDIVVKHFDLVSDVSADESPGVRSFVGYK